VNNVDEQVFASSFVVVFPCRQSSLHSRIVHVRHPRFGDAISSAIIALLIHSFKTLTHEILPIAFLPLTQIDKSQQGAVKQIAIMAFVEPIVSGTLGA
jgi:hypothetical protein